MSVSARKGFVPCRLLNGGQAFPMRRYQTDTNLLRTLAVGDPVTLNSGFLQRWVTAQASGFVGVVAAVYNSNGRPLTFNQPTGGPYLPASTAGFIDVFDSPSLTYVVECQTSIGQSDIGKTADVNVTAVQTAAGISGFHLTKATAQGSPDMNFRIIALAPSELAVTAAGSPNNKVEVQIIRHLYSSPMA